MNVGMSVMAAVAAAVLGATSPAFAAERSSSEPRETKVEIVPEPTESPRFLKCKSVRHTCYVIRDHTGFSGVSTRFLRASYQQLVFGRQALGTTKIVHEKQFKSGAGFIHDSPDLRVIVELSTQKALQLLVLF